MVWLARWTFRELISSHLGQFLGPNAGDRDRKCVSHAPERGSDMKLLVVGRRRIFASSYGETTGGSTVQRPQLWWFSAGYYGEISS